MPNKIKRVVYAGYSNPAMLEAGRREYDSNIEEYKLEVQRLKRQAENREKSVRKAVKDDQAKKKQYLSDEDFEEYRKKVIDQSEGKYENPWWEHILGETVKDAAAGAGTGAAIGFAGGSIGGPLAGLTATGGFILGGSLGTITGLVTGTWDVLNGDTSPKNNTLRDYTPINATANLLSNLIDPNDVLQKQIDNTRNIGGFKTQQEYSQKAISDAELRYINKHPQEKNSVQDAVINNAIQQRKAEYGSLIMSDQEKYDKAENIRKQTEEEALLDYIYNGQKPNGYGLFSSEYWADVHTKYLKNLNEAQKDTFNGNIIRQQDVLKNLELDLINLKSKTLREDHQLLTDFLAHPNDKSLIQNVKEKFGTSDYAEIRNIRNRVSKQLIDALDGHSVQELDKASEYMMALTPTSWIGKASTGISRFADTVFTPLSPVTWWGTPADEMDALRYNLIGYDTATPLEKIRLLEKYKKESEDKIKYWQYGAKANQAEMDELDRKHKVSDYFEYMERHSNGFILSGDTWMYKMPGLIGSSQSSWAKQLPGTIATIASMTPWGRGASTLAKGLIYTGVGLSIPLGISSGRDENAAEVAQNYKENFINKLTQHGLYNRFIEEGSLFVKGANEHKKTYKKGEIPEGVDPNKMPKYDQEYEQEVIEQFMRGYWKTNDLDINDQAVNALSGVNSLFQNDMAAVTTDELVDGMLKFNTVGAYLSKAGKIDRAVRYVEKGLTPFKNPIGPAFGIMKKTVAAGASKIAETKLGQKILKEAQEKTRFISSIPRELMSTKGGKLFDKIAKKSYEKTIGRLSPSTIPGQVYWKDTKDTFKFASKTAGISMFSEGIEEGKQYLHGQEYQRGEYSEDTYKTLLNVDRLLRDSWDGARSALVALGVPFGLQFTSDDEFAENVRGGMLGGLFLTGAMQYGGAMFDTVHNRFGEDGSYRIAMDLVNKGLLDKAALREVYLKAEQYAKDFQGGVNNYDKTLSVLDSIIENNKKNKDTNPDLYIDPDSLEKQKALYQTVALLTNKEIGIGKQIDEVAKKYNIDRDSDRFNKYIGIVASAIDSQNDADITTLEKSKAYNQALELILRPYQLDDKGNVNYVMDTVINGLKHRLEQVVKPLLKDDGTVLEGKELQDEMNKRFHLNISLYTDISALILLRDEINSAASASLVPETTSKDVAFLNKRIDAYLDNVLSFIKPEHRDKVKQEAYDYIKQVEGIDDLIATSRSLFLSKMDRDYASMQLQGILGEFNKPTEESEDQKRMNLSYSEIDPNQIIDQLEDAIKEDKLLAQRIADDFDEHYGNREQWAKKHQILLRKMMLDAEEAAANENKDTEINSWIPTVKARKALYSPEEIYDSAYKVAKKFKEAKNINEAIEVLKEAGLGLVGNDQRVFGDRLSKLYDQYKEGKISRKQFAMAFVQELDRNSFNANTRNVIDDNGNPLPTRSRKKYERGKRKPRGKNKAKSSKDSAFDNTVDQSITVTPGGPENVSPTQDQPTPANINPVVAPSADPASLQDPSSNVDDNNPQQKAWNMLQAHIADTDAKLMKDANGDIIRTGHDYFMLENGVPTLYTRVHGVLDNQYTPSASETELENKIIERLKNATDLESEAKKIVEENQPNHKLLIYIDPYFDYLKDDRVPQKDKDANKDYIIRAIADIIAHPIKTESVNVGNMFDEICRVFFSGKELNYDTLTFNRFGKQTLVSQYLDKSVFNAFLVELNEWKNKFEKDRWILSTDSTRFYGKFIDNLTGEVVNMCGETDMIAIDENGNFKIIDFKTSFKPFYTVMYGSGPKNAFEDNTSVISKTGYVKKRSTKEQYTMQQSMYYIMMKNNMDCEIDLIFIFPIQVGFRSDSNDNLLPEAADGSKAVYKGTNRNDKNEIFMIPLQLDSNITGRYTVDDVVDFENEIRDLNRVIILANDALNTYEENKDKLPESVRDNIIKVKQHASDLLNKLSDTSDTNTITKEDVVITIDTIVSALKSLNDFMNSEIDTQNAQDIEELHYQLYADEYYGSITEDEFIESQTSWAEHYSNTINDSFDLTYDKLCKLLRQLMQGRKSGPLLITNEDAKTLIAYRNYLYKILLEYGSVVNPEQREKFSKTDAWMSQNIIVVGNQPVNVPQIPIPVIREDAYEGDQTWKALTTTWKRSMENSKALDGSGLKLSQVSGNPDFVTNSTIEYTLKGQQLQVSITYKGIKFEPVDVHYADGRQDVYNNIVAMIRNANGRMVVPKAVSRTNGKFIPAKDGSRATLIERGFVSEDELYDIEFSRDLTRFGMTRSTNVGGVMIIDVVTPGSASADRVSTYQYSPDNTTKPHPGLMVMMVERQYDEVRGRKPVVPMNMLNTRLSDKDADLIINILRGQFATNKNTTAEGLLDQEFTNAFGMGLTNRQVLNLLINYGNVGRKEREHVHLKYDNKNPRIIHIIGNVEGDPDTNPDGSPALADRTFNLFDDQSVVDFKLFLMSKVDRHIDWNFMKSRLLMHDDLKNHPMNGFRRFITSSYGQTLLNTEGKIQFGESSIVFEKDDLVNPKTGEDHGLSGLAWYIKHGFLETDCVGIENTLLNFDHDEDVEYQDRDQQPTKPSNEGIAPNYPLVPPTIINDESADGIIDEPDFFERKQWFPWTSTVSEKTVRDHLADIFGEEFASNGVRYMQSTYSIVTKRHWVGLCMADAILIRSDAVIGTEYHEAFHRVAEFILSDEERQAVYDEQRRKGQWLYIAKRKDDSEIAEHLAEKFRRYMNNLNVINSKESGKIKRFFAKAFNWVRMWTAGENTRRLFQKINSGAFKNIKPTLEAIDRTKRIFGKRLPMEVGGVKFKYINDNNIDPLVRSLTYLIFRSLAVDKAGRDVESKLTAENLSAKAVYNMKFVQDVLNGKGLFKDLQVEDETKECIKEFILNWDILKDSLYTHISGFTSGYKDVKVSEEEDKQGGSTSTTYQNRSDEQRFDKRSAEFSHIDRASKLIKHMFSRIVKARYVNGKLEFILNELGLPEYYSYKDTLSMTFNQMHECQTVDEFILELDKRSNTNPAYRQISKWIKELKESAKTNPNDEALLVEIRTIVRSHKEQLNQVRVTDDGNFIFESCASEYNAREYATRWSNAFAYGVCQYIEQDEKGEYVFSVNPNTGKRYSTAIFKAYYQYLFGTLNINGQKIGLQYAFSTKGREDYEEYMRDNMDEYRRKLSERLRTNPSSVTKDMIRKLTNYKVAFININGQTVPLDITNPEHVEKVKENIVLMLNSFGISITKESFDHMLFEKYGFNDYLAIRELFEEGNTGIRTFGTFLNSLITHKVKNDANSPEVLNIENGHVQGLGRDKKGRGKNVKVDDVFNHVAFVKELGNFEYSYQLTMKETSSLGMNNNRSYTITENNTITDFVDDITRAMSRGIRSEYIDNILAFHYNMLKDDSDDNTVSKNAIGSIICKLINSRFELIEYENKRIAEIVDEERRELAQNELQNSRIGKNKISIRFINFAGMKAPSKDNSGTEYEKMSKREDYVSKAQLLASGYMLFPTMSDKKTWGVLSGVNMPGINYNNITETFMFNDYGQTFGISGMNSVFDQLLEYALTEDRTVQDAINQVYGGINEQGERFYPMSDDEKIENFHNGKKIKVVVGYHKKTDEKTGEFLKDKNGKFIWEEEVETHTTINGARYFSLIGVYDDNGVYHDFNKTKQLVKYVTLDMGDGTQVSKPIYKYMSEEDNRKEAHKWFFGNIKRDSEGNELRDEQGNVIYETEEETVERQRNLLRNNIKYHIVEQLRYVEELGLIKLNPDASGRPLIYQYTNVGLPKTMISSLINKIKQNDSTITEAEAQSLAVANYITDVSIKHIMSLQEVERVFSGHPGFYKCNWNENGELIDRTVDQHKRLGGLVSTGKNNVLDVANVPTHYVCALVDNEMIQSPIIEDIERLNIEGEIRQLYVNDMVEKNEVTFDENTEYMKDVHSKTIDEIKDYYNQTEEGQVALAAAIARAKSTTDKFRKDDKHEGIDVADGAAYITDEMCEHLLRMVGSWNDEIKEAFDILRGKTKYTSKDIVQVADAYNKVYTSVIGAQKYSAYGFRMQNGVLIPYYNKMALFPLFKCMATGKTAQLLLKMKDLKIDMLMVKSAVKLGGQGSKSVKIHEDDILSNDFKFVTYEESFKNLRKQFNTDPKEDEEDRAMGTQMLKVALSALLPGREYTIEDAVGKYSKVSATDLRNRIMGSINEISRLGVEQFQKEFYGKDGKVDINKLGKFIKRELSGRNASRELIDAFTIVTEREINGEKVKLSKPEFKVPMVAAANMNWIQSILVAKVNSHVVDINLPGHAFIQRSVWGMEGETKIINDTNLPNSLYEGNKLKMLNEEGSMDCILSIDFFEDIFKQHPKLKGASFAQKRQFLINNGIISGRKKDGTWSNATANIIGSRIPTQAVSSIHALRCVDVLPVIRDTVVLPEEFTKITGSDFDIDKIYLNRLVYKRVKVDEYVDEHGKSHNHKLTCDFDETTMDYHKNNLLRSYIAALKDTPNENSGDTRSMHKLHSPIDGDTELLTSIVDDLYDAEPKRILPYSAYSLSDAVKTKDEFMSGKEGIGPYALNNNSLILTMLYGIEFAHNKDSVLTKLGLDSLHRTNDIDGNPILSWLSGLINAHVDVAKDPYISKLNVNKFTWNIVSTLIRTGLGKQTFYFIKQPIMELLATAVNNASGTYMQDSNKSQFVRQLEAELDLILKYINAHVDPSQQFTSYEEAIDMYESHLENRFKTSITSICAMLLKQGTNLEPGFKNILYSSVKNHVKIDNKDVKFNFNGHSISMFDLQMMTYITYTKLKPQIQALSDFVQYTKIDTKKQGKNIVEILDYQKGYNNVFKDGSKHQSHFLFDVEGLRRLRDKSYIGFKTNAAISAFFDLLGSQTIEATNGFKQDIIRISSRLQMDDDLNKKNRKLLSQQILAYVKSKFFFENGGYCDKWNINPRSLVNGKDTISHKLQKLLLLFANDLKYKGMLDEHGRCVNELLNALVPSFTHVDTVEQFASPYTQPETYDDVHLIKMPDFTDNDTNRADKITQAWLVLLNDYEHPELQQFARELIVYAFMTSGDNGGQHDLCKYIPNQWKINPDGSGFELSYASFMLRILESYKTGAVLTNDEIDDIILNCWHRPGIIKHEKLEGFTSYKTGKVTVSKALSEKTTQTQEKEIAYPTLLSAFTIKNNKIVPKYDDVNLAPAFIKIKRPGINDRYSSKQYMIYKKIGVGTKKYESVNEEGKTVVGYHDIPMYELCDAKGNAFEKGYMIYEFCRSDRAGKSEAIQSLSLDQSLINLISSLANKMTREGKELKKLNNLKDVFDFLLNPVLANMDKKGAYTDIYAEYMQKPMYEMFEQFLTSHELMLEQQDNDDEVLSLEQQMDVLETAGRTNTVKNTEGGAQNAKELSNTFSEEEKKEGQDIKKHCEEGE